MPVYPGAFSSFILSSIPEPAPTHLMAASCLTALLIE
jgi:hypothetical protein